MDVRRLGVLMLLCAAACALVAYESYRFNAVAVERFLNNAQTRDVFTQLEPGVPVRSRITGFLAIVFAVAGVKLMLTRKSASPPQ
jgi:hypothetical protein